MKTTNKEKQKVFSYKCSKCGKTYLRDSTKKWIKSYCEPTGQYSRLMRVEDNK